MKTLILSDVHTHIGKVDEILRREPCERCIIVGDFFDQFYDTPETNRATAEWLKPKLYDDRFVILLGNHDFNNYSSWTNEPFWCSGYHAFKDIEINKVLNNDDWDRFKWYYVLDNTFLMTHAGLHRYHYPDCLSSELPVVKEWLDSEVKSAINHANNKEWHWIYSAGFSRGGSLQEGGTLWCDFTREFVPIRGLNQIVGHTPQIAGAKWCILDEKSKEKRAQFLFASKYMPKINDYHNKDLSINLCIDTKLSNYAVWDGTEIKIKEFGRW